MDLHGNIANEKIKTKTRYYYRLFSLFNFPRVAILDFMTSARHKTGNSVARDGRPSYLIFSTLKCFLHFFSGTLWNLDIVSKKLTPTCSKNFLESAANMIVDGPRPRSRALLIPHDWGDHMRNPLIAPNRFDRLRSSWWLQTIAAIETIRKII